MLTQPYKWHGGKFYLRHKIIEQFPPHLHYVETHFGAGAVFLARDNTRDWFINEQWKLQNGEKVPASLKGCSEVINDINQEVTNFWVVMQSDEWMPAFIRQVKATPFSQDQWESAATPHSGNGHPIKRAAAFFVRYRQSRQGLGKCFATLSRNRTRRGMNEQASSWLTAIEGLPELHERLKGVVILNQDACDVIKSQDGDKTLFYCDPSYLHKDEDGTPIRVTTQDYEHEMSLDDHVRLLGTLSSIQGKFILSGYHSKLYERYRAKMGWRTVEWKIDNKASSKATKKIMTEVVWCNF